MVTASQIKSNQVDKDSNAFLNKTAFLVAKNDVFDHKNTQFGYL